MEGKPKEIISTSKEIRNLPKEMGGELNKEIIIELKKFLFKPWGFHRTRTGGDPRIKPKEIGNLLEEILISILKEIRSILKEMEGNRRIS
jgi:hypothetical protein